MEHYAAMTKEAMYNLDQMERLLLKQPDRWRQEYAVLTAYFDAVAEKGDGKAAYIAENWMEFRGELLQLRALKEHVSHGLDPSGEVYDYYFSMVDDLLDGEEEPFTAQVEEMLAAMLATAAPRLSRDRDPVAYAADQMQDTLKWVHGHGDESDFMLWLQGELDEPTQMNCYDAVFYSAYLAGAVSHAAIRAAYADVLNGTGYASVESALGMGHGIPLESALSEGLQPGDVIIFDGDSAAHVALCLGGGDVMSLWGHNGGRFSRLSLLDIMGDYALSAMTVARKGSTIFR